MYYKYPNGFKLRTLKDIRLIRYLKTQEVINRVCADTTWMLNNRRANRKDCTFTLEHLLQLLTYSKNVRENYGYLAIRRHVTKLHAMRVESSRMSLYSTNYNADFPVRLMNKTIFPVVRGIIFIKLGHCTNI